MYLGELLEGNHPNGTLAGALGNLFPDLSLDFTRFGAAVEAELGSCWRSDSSLSEINREAGC
jgi:hypothetical protein